MTTMTSTQAYAAMFYFLEELYERTHSNELGGLLGSMALLEDGSPADGGLWQDWQRAIEKALQEGKAGAHRLNPE